MQTFHFTPMALIPFALATALLLISACGGEQKKQISSFRAQLLQGTLLELAATSTKGSWDEELNRLGLTSIDGQYLLVEIRYIAGASANLRTQLKQNGYRIQLIKRHYERINVWVSSAKELSGLTLLDGVSLITQAPITDLLTSQIEVKP